MTNRRDTREIRGFRPFWLAKQLFELSYVRAVLAETRGNISQAALIARKDRKDFYDLMRKVGVDPDEFRNGNPKETTE